jgi:hypothetical protein
MGTPSATQYLVLGEGGVHGVQFLQAPTIVAWDIGAFCRILPLEARSP